ncbi:MAG: hypothetical protein HYY06_16605 [Deltaproteobacteria bacterium]|nr:hypothetical protein [Deltaproteobacteria bacterium]
MTHEIIALCLLGLAACGPSAPPGDEVTTTVTEGDEEAWSEEGDPPPAREGDEDGDER